MLGSFLVAAEFVAFKEDLSSMKLLSSCVNYFLFVQLCGSNILEVAYSTHRCIPFNIPLAMWNIL
jgi:uncharacterized membrane protein